MRIHNFLHNVGIITEIQAIVYRRDHDDAGKEKFKDQTSLKVVLKHN